MKGQKGLPNYVLQDSTVTGDVVVDTPSLSNGDVTRLQHMPLGHMNENGMAELSKRGLLNGQGINKLKFCEHYIFGKQERVKFTKGIHNTNGTLDYTILISKDHLGCLLKEVLVIC